MGEGGDCSAFEWPWSWRGRLCVEQAGSRRAAILSRPPLVLMSCHLSAIFGDGEAGTRLPCVALVLSPTFICVEHPRKPKQFVMRSWYPRFLPLSPPSSE